MALTRETPRGTEIAIKVVARSSRARVAGRVGERLKVCVASQPERGRANAEVVRILAAHFGVPRARVRILSGETAPLKQVLLEGVPRGEAEERIHADP